jgi:hypothetical protein
MPATAQSNRGALPGTEHNNLAASSDARVPATPDRHALPCSAYRQDSETPHYFAAVDEEQRIPRARLRRDTWQREPGGLPPPVERVVNPLRTLIFWNGSRDIHGCSLLRLLQPPRQRRPRRSRFTFTGARPKTSGLPLGGTTYRKRGRRLLIRSSIRARTLGERIQRPSRPLQRMGSAIARGFSSTHPSGPRNHLEW